MPGEADKGKVRTGAGTDIFCALDLHHHTEKAPQDLGAGMRRSILQRKKQSLRLIISPSVTQFVTDKVKQEPASVKLRLPPAWERMEARWGKGNNVGSSSEVPKYTSCATLTTSHSLLVSSFVQWV